MARLGPEAFAEAEREGLEAPPPTPEVVALVRRVFRPTLLKMHAELSRMT